PSRLTEVAEILPPETELPETIVACDVRNPLLGVNGCTAIYAPQKGVKPEEQPDHEKRLQHLVALLDGETMALVPGSGAAGGLGFGSLAFLDATLKPGFEMVADGIGLAEEIEKADLVITGEGCIDDQSLEGKAPAGVAAAAKAAGKPVLAFCGLKAISDSQELFDHIYPIDRGELSVDESIARGEELLTLTARNAISEWLGKSQA
ncbi:MAG: glycerate kinase, partial [Verrucomicrobiota bacterium]